jgi:hypothetical protein
VIIVFLISHINQNSKKMKRFCLTITIAVFLLFCFNRIQGQTTQPKLNQIELMKQLIGKWKSDPFQDSVWVGECKPFGKGLEWTSKTTIKDKTVSEAKAFIGYDKKNDKLIECDINKTTSDITLYSILFTSSNKFMVVPYENVTSPDKASILSKYEFKSADLMTETDTKDDKTIGTYTFHRMKQ